MTLLGRQEPVLASVARGDTARGDEAVAFARWCGLTLYPWQEDLLRDMCRTDGVAWAHREVVVSVARQNGKGEVLVARELAGIFLFGEKLIFHSAHFTDTAIDAQGRLFDIIESNPDLMNWWDGEFPGQPWMSKTNGKENVSFPNGATVLFRTRTKKTGRGLSVDLLILDECFDLPNDIYAALSKTIRARQSAQSVFISSPVDRIPHRHGAIFSAKRWSGIDGAEGVLFREWSMPEGADPFSMESMAAANPSLVDEGPGAQLSDIKLDAAAARNSEVMLDIYMVETLGVGRWELRDGDLEQGPPPELDAATVEAAMTSNVARVRRGRVVLAIDGSPDGAACSISLGAPMVETEGRVFGALLWHGPMNVDQVVEAFVELYGHFAPTEVWLDSKSPAEVVVQPLLRRLAAVNGRSFDPDIVKRMSWPNVRSSTGAMLAGIKDRRFVLGRSTVLAEGFNCAITRDVDGQKAWDRKSGVICQVVATSHAMWAANTFVEEEVKRQVVMPEAIDAPMVAGAAALTF